jgi:ABC-type uncharacterized transport system substrate-binding protein
MHFFRLVDEVVNPDVFHHIAQFATKERLPSILGSPEYAAAGGLVGYGPTVTEVYRRAAVYVDKILKGAKPGDLPIEQPTRFELRDVQDVVPDRAALNSRGSRGRDLG